MIIAVSQINPIIGDFEHNSSLILDECEEARKSGCSLIVFPELCLMGYPPKDLLEKPADIEVLTEKIKQASAQRMLLVSQEAEDKIKDILASKGW